MISKVFQILLLSSVLFGCSQSVSVNTYNRHFLQNDLNDLYRIDLNEISGLRQEKVKSISNGIRLMWLVVINKNSSKADRLKAYQTLRMIAIQNEKHPVSEWNSDPEIKEIFASAIENDKAHAERLRQRNWLSIR